jgi:hypothetical protein
MLAPGTRQALAGAVNGFVGAGTGGSGYSVTVFCIALNAEYKCLGSAYYRECTTGRLNYFGHFVS